MKAWKLYLSDNFEYVVGAGASIFTDYGKMLKYLTSDGRNWLITELDVKESELAHDMFCEGMATLLVNKRCNIKEAISSI
jgi:hypothetical protein